jgi:hypothetical protein
METETFDRKEKAALSMLEIINKDIPLPSMRMHKQDWRWFLRNLRINHSAHPLFSTTMELIKFIVRHEHKLRS